MVGQKPFPGGQAKLIDDGQASVIRWRIAELRGKLGSTDTNEHGIIHINRHPFWVKYESEHCDDLFPCVSTCMRSGS
jgi:hypothetical protein